MVVATVAGDLAVIAALQAATGAVVQIDDLVQL